jgi:anion-transporting  ArsA/GET3 family ATPase
VRTADPLEKSVLERRILVVCGSGGVGKTTTAAALGLRAALSGRKVLVCTIDPSRRLATSLGLNQLPGRPRALDIERLEPRRGGSLWAMMLDTKRTFDTLVEAHAPDEQARRRILENRFYQQVSAALAGSHEYMAMEKLLELQSDKRFELIVLDTPPTRHALDFLEAPDRMLAFLDTSILRWFLKPYFVAGRLTLRVATRTGAFALKLADRALGLQFLQDLSEFFLAFDGMYEGFKERAAAVHALLRDPDSGFVLVASPARGALDEALYFHRRLREGGMPFVSFVVNRIHPDPSQAPVRRASARDGASELDAGLRQKLEAVFRDHRRVAAAERRSVSRLQARTGEPIVLVPEMDVDVHDLRGLREVADALFSAELPGRRRTARNGARAVAVVSDRGQQES